MGSVKQWLPERPSQAPLELGSPRGHVTCGRALKKNIVSTYFFTIINDKK